MELLSDQYRKKAELYRTPVLIAPLGDDFRYDTEREVRDQYSNYEWMMEYVDAHPELNIKVREGGGGGRGGGGGELLTDKLCRKYIHNTTIIRCYE